MSVKKKSLVVIKRKTKRNNNMLCFSAWCSGTAYHYPNKVFVCRKTMEIALFWDSVYLANFHFDTIKDYKNALRIAKRAINNSQEVK